MSAARKFPFDKGQLQLTRARLRAWWEGETFDAEAAAAALAAGDSATETTGADKELFDEPAFDYPPRLQALSKLWGDNRVRPGDDTADGLEPARIGIAADGVLAVLGPGLVGPIIAIAAAHPGKIEVFEWRDETLEALKYGVRKAGLEERVSVTRIDLEAHVWTPGFYDGLLSVDDFAYAAFPPHLAAQIMKLLKPGACAVVECYAGLQAPELATAFASSFAEPQIRAHGDLRQFFLDVGLNVDAEEDLTEEFLDLARQGFKRLGEALAQAAKFDAASARELAWEAEAWRMRLKLLAQRRLQRLRFILRKPGADAVAPDTAPEAAQPA